MTIAPVGDITIPISYWVAILLRLCHAPRLRIVRWFINSCATSPSDAHVDKGEAAFRV